jgi:hypothetical protein
MVRVGLLEMIALLAMVGVAALAGLVYLGSRALNKKK